ncbi:MAG: glycosyltransferase [Candidatus Cloacimonetes bacterium]|nr:glycosyltransferase [Candidatus Cloacimonadota bacterium]
MEKEQYLEKIKAFYSNGETERAYKMYNSLVTRFGHSNLPDEYHRLFKQKKSVPETDSLNILFIQDSPCIRNYKYALALKEKGHNVTLGYFVQKLSEHYTGLSDNVYKQSIKINNNNELWKLSGQFDLIHSHNEPDLYTVAAMAGNCPVVHDTHDLISLRDPQKKELRYYEGIANRAAHGRIYSTPYQRDEARMLYGVEGDSLIFYNYASQSHLPKYYLQKLSEKDGKIHIVYEGGVKADGGKHRDFTKQFLELSERGFKVHIYPAVFNAKLFELFKDYPNIEYNHPISPEDLITVMSQYDYGIIPWNINSANERFLASTIANKLFEYLAAGLPVATADLKSYQDFFRENPVGLTFENIEDFVNKIPQLFEIKNRLVKEKPVFTYEKEIDTLIEYYRKVISRFKTSRIINENEVNRKALSQKAKHDGILSNSIKKLLNWFERNGWKGYDPYDVEDYIIQQNKNEIKLSKEEEKRIRLMNDSEPMKLRLDLGITPKINAKAMGLLLSAYLDIYSVSHEEKLLCEAERISDWLLDNNSPKFRNLCWGYPFDWQSLIFIPKGTPSVVVSTVVGDGFWKYYKVTGKKEFLEVCKSVCQFIICDLNKDFLDEKTLCFSYTPLDDFHVHNANLFAAEFLIRVGYETDNALYIDLGLKAVNYAISEQNQDGSIFYWGLKQICQNHGHLDSYHSGFEIRMLYSIYKLTQVPEIKTSYERYLKFYIKTYIREDGLVYQFNPKRNPNKVNIHGVAEAILMLSELSDEYPELISIIEKITRWTVDEFQVTEGWFGYMIINDKKIMIPYLRWAQAWMLRALGRYLTVKKNIKTSIDRKPFHLPSSNNQYANFSEISDMLKNTQYSNLSDVRQFQEHMMRRLVKHCYENVPYYTKLFKDLNLTPDDFQIKEDLKKIPILTKRDILDNYDDFISRDSESSDILNIFTSGSTGSPFKLVSTKYLNNVLEKAFVWRHWNWAGYYPGDKELCIRGRIISKEKNNGHFYEVVRNTLFISSFHLNESINLNYNLINEFQPKVIRAYPFSIYYMTLQLIEKGFSKIDSIKSIITSSETLRDDQREIIESFWGCKIFDWYGHGEHCVAAGQCELGSYHFNEEYGITEFLIDDTTGYNRIISTSLHNFVFPLLRYDTGDLCTKELFECSCGRKLPACKKIVGRLDDFIVTPSGNFIGDSALSVSGKLSTGISSFQLIQHSDGSVDVIIVKNSKYKEEDFILLNKGLRNRLGDIIKLNYIFRKETIKGKSGKTRFVQSKLCKSFLEKKECYSRKPVVCHIGGAHSVHVASLVNWLDKLGYRQFVISYNEKEKKMTVEHVPVYYLDYHRYSVFAEEMISFRERIERSLKQIFLKEKPDLIHCHSLTMTCVALSVSKKMFNLPTLVFPWSKRTIDNPDVFVNELEREALLNTDFFIHGLPKMVDLFEQFYQVELKSKHLPFIGSDTNLQPFTRQREIKGTPKILTSRMMGDVYHQDLLIRVLPRLFNLYPDLQVTCHLGHNKAQALPYQIKMKELARNLGILDRIRFIEEVLPFEQFVDLVYQHNINYSVASGEHGFSFTAIQSAFSGAITIVQNASEIDGVLEHDVNILKTDLNEQSIFETIKYSIDNLVILQEKFIFNNKFLEKYKFENQMNLLEAAYNKLIKGE